MRVALVDAGGANLGSVQYALQRLGVQAELATRSEQLQAADRVILPGVSTAATVMARLHELDLVDSLRQLQAPLLGVCVGMQLLFEHSEEDDTPCLGLLPGYVRKLPASPGIRVPHMGWNDLQALADSPLLEGIAAGERAYFVHSYAAPVSQDCIASVQHGTRFAAVVQRGRIGGAQFHPERSATVGARLLKNFIETGLA